VPTNFCGSTDGNSRGTATTASTAATTAASTTTAMILVLERDARAGGRVWAGPAGAPRPGAGSSQRSLSSNGDGGETTGAGSRPASGGAAVKPVAVPQVVQWVAPSRTLVPQTAHEAMGDLPLSRTLDTIGRYRTGNRRP
jgi:hypothetical protein